MNQNTPSLLILAAGMGSRYGGLKQMDEFGPNGETIIDYSIYDALEAGFQRIVFVIRKSFSSEFEQRMNLKWGSRAQLVYVYQELDILPGDVTINIERQKPWGTGHAVWVCKDHIPGRFGVINADDYYGKQAMSVLYTFLLDSADYGLIAYYLKDTLSEHGAVNRGICSTNSEGHLNTIKETRNIFSIPSIHYFESDTEVSLSPETLVSMNMWALDYDFFDYAEQFFRKFLDQKQNLESAEFYIPELIQELIDNNLKIIRIIKSNSKWFGVTYQEDKNQVSVALAEMIAAGVYPTPL